MKNLDGQELPEIVTREILTAKSSSVAIGFQKKSKAESLNVTTPTETVSPTQWTTTIVLVTEVLR